MIAFTGGITRMVISGGANELLGQVILSFYILLESYPIIEGMAWRKDTGQVPASVALLSFVLSIIFLLLGSVVLRLIWIVLEVHNKSERLQLCASFLNPINFLLLSNDADKSNSPVSQDDLIRTKLQNTGTCCLRSLRLFMTHLSSLTGGTRNFDTLHITT